MEKRFYAKKYGNNQRFPEGTVFPDKSIFGYNNVFGAHCVFGDHCIFDTNCRFGSDTSFGMYSRFYDHAQIGYGSIIGQGSTIGDLCTVEPACIIGRYSDIGCHGLFTSVLFENNCRFEHDNYFTDCEFGVGCCFEKDNHFNGFCLFGPHCRGADGKEILLLQVPVYSETQVIGQTIQFLFDRQRNIAVMDSQEPKRTFTLNQYSKYIKQKYRWHKNRNAYLQAIKLAKELAKLQQ